ncbi:MAG TPA: type II toxin-antitoxin system RelE/ParE family toxin [Verrucomicrobiales bacterium]|nr:type II toxin-antitoxin system RelE/ParE family toxin [Verrucomicrobiales bacterium]
MPGVLRTRRSREDYDAIYDHIAGDSPQNADMIIQLLEEKVELLASYPSLGRRRSELGAGLRSSLVHGFILFYRPAGDGIELIRVVNGSMDITPRFFV